MLDLAILLLATVGLLWCLARAYRVWRGTAQRHLYVTLAGAVLFLMVMVFQFMVMSAPAA